jgi:hypothetical protein
MYHLTIDTTLCHSFRPIPQLLLCGTQGDSNLRTISIDYYKMGYQKHPCNLPEIQLHSLNTATISTVSTIDKDRDMG